MITQISVMVENTITPQILPDSSQTHNQANCGSRCRMSRLIWLKEGEGYNLVKHDDKSNKDRWPCLEPDNQLLKRPILYLKGFRPFRFRLDCGNYRRKDGVESCAVDGTDNLPIACRSCNINMQLYDEASEPLWGYLGDPSYVKATKGTH